MEKLVSSVPQVLAREYLARRKSNPYFSKRAFAKILGLPSGRLSELMSGKRPLTPELAIKISEGLKYSPGKASKILKLAKDHKRQRRIRARLPMLPASVDNSFQELEEDSFSVLANWEHFAILSLMDTKDFDSSPLWIAERLGVGPGVAINAVGRLIRMQLIRMSNGRLIKTQNQFQTTDQICSKALKVTHRQILQNAIGCIDGVSVEERDFSTMSLAIHPKRIKQAKTLIRNFRRQFALLVEKGLKTEVYNLNIQFVPVTKVSAK